ncbi:DeoR/GlpR transcriptional regulator [Zophobihabitans entericus]|uniref:DeoR/GlpR transcriptional regulator n=2 Tax=Zophobihabitans entericus TaxID=1635327 RepID=A0A6G9IDT5_9GAMM|nr:DeoR/GlpR transcriptional regulator [Zophobihabitans entericus]
MKLNQRQQNILQLLNRQGKVSVAELAEKTAVSVVTIRHDLTLLEQENYLKREHGFAVLLDIDNVDDRLRVNFTQKQALAQLAATLIEPGDTIFIEGGSSNALLARVLARQSDLTIITANLYIASLLKNSPVEVILLGGLLQSKSENVVGPLTKQLIKQIHFNKAFIGIDGFHAEYGFTGRDMMRAEVIDTVLEKNAENIIISESSKFGKIYPYSLQAAGFIKKIVTDNKITPEQEAQFKRLHIEMLKLD